MSDVISTHRLSEQAILKMLNAAIEKARALRSPSGIGIFDAGGHLRAWVLMDGATPLAFDAVRKKGKTAAFTGAPSGNVPAEVAGRLALAIEDFANLPGGFPVKVNGETIGAVAAGGGTHEADAAIAEAALGAIALGKGV